MNAVVAGEERSPLVAGLLTALGACFAASALVIWQRVSNPERVATAGAPSPEVRAWVAPSAAEDAVHQPMAQAPASWAGPASVAPETPASEVPPAPAPAREAALDVTAQVPALVDSVPGVDPVPVVDPAPSAPVDAPRGAPPCSLALHYEKNATQPLLADQDQITRLGAWLKTQPEVPVLVRAHADGSGSTQHNFILSERRAGWISSRLVALGVAADRISAQASWAPEGRNHMPRGK